ncbi:MOSC domain-containing protein [uncultured Gammaproteobacteria bacterium]
MHNGDMSEHLAKIHRYPVKGLSAQELESADLTPGQGLAMDRRFAITHGATTFDVNAPVWRPKSNFLTLVRTERLAALQTEFDADTATLTVRRGPRVVARGRIDTPIGRSLIDQFLAAFLSGHVLGVPRLVEAPGTMFTDREEKLVAVINLASLGDLERRVVRQPVDCRRFRANLLLDGFPPWVENNWVGKVLAIGNARLAIVEPIERCAVTNINPTTGTCDLNIPQALHRGFGHARFGVYARVITGGTVAVGNTAAIVAPN